MVFLWKNAHLIQIKMVHLHFNRAFVGKDWMASEGIANSLIVTLLPEPERPRFKALLYLTSGLMNNYVEKEEHLQ